MNKRLIVLFFFICVSLHAFSQITFQKVLGGMSADEAKSVKETPDSGYIIAASSLSLGNGSYDIYLVKTNANGDTLWTKTYGGVQSEQPQEIVLTNDGGFIICGTTYGNGIGNSDFFLIKTDSNGDSLWTKAYGGTNIDIGYSISQSLDTGYIVTGYFKDSTNGDYNISLIKTDANGNLQWRKTFGGLGDDLGLSVQQTFDGGFIIAGKYAYSLVNVDVCLIKTDVGGNTIWMKTYGDIGGELGFCVKQTLDSGFVVTGHTDTFGVDVFLLKTDINGNKLWAKAYGGALLEYGLDVQQIMDGGYIITGLTNSFGAGNGDVYLVRTDINGNMLWTKSYGGSNYDYGFSVQQTLDSGFIITGFTYSFGAGNSDIYLIKTDTQGNSLCNQTNPTSIASSPTTITTSLPITLTSPITFVTTPITLVSNGGIVNTLCTNVSINETSMDKNLIVFPNPSDGKITISTTGKFLNGIIEICSVFGNKIYSDKIKSTSNNEISLKNITNGVYFVKVFNEDKYYCKKITVERN